MCTYIKLYEQSLTVKKVNSSLHLCTYKEWLKMFWVIISIMYFICVTKENLKHKNHNEYK